MLDACLDTYAVRRLIELALEEDLGRGDVTSQAVIGPRAVATARLVAREPLVLAGLGIGSAVFTRVDNTLAVTELAKDGEKLPAGAEIASISGRALSILAAERTALNFVQHLSGIATLTRAFVEAAGPEGPRIADTRKTTPGFRPLDKYAVRAGGGSNHRHDLGSGVLIKDNHVAIMGGIGPVVAEVRGRVPHGLKIEVEVDSLTQLDEAWAAGADIILLDNFSLPDIEQAVARTRARQPRPLLEVSGGVTLSRMPDLVRTGIDVISIGALTHSAPAVDLALDIAMS
ncbi:MAG: carboxylating nicotinate-nucleotide diphosphorylase [Polyangia bacterium]|jgi:nicotinate-nucleotide pyrophosphorylase (carboxylating)